ncbi:MAG TPA: hypothetical protein DET40_00650 [Lentisphaeria bacterium]|nr:MAG: hypothetical protein A2X45_21125 [Lentisphaerae bacterium GWF2_50_93]HCE42042.1 hypothetical protein [Lentisphaeria bacterium]
MNILKSMGLAKVLALAVSAAAGLYAWNCQAQEPLVKNGDKIAFLGDSITQQGGNNPGGYVNLILKGLEVNGIKVEAIKAGISGNKSNDMLARLDGQVISKKPNFMTLSCGVNDVWHGDRGVPLDQYKTNITAILDKAQVANVKVVILTSTLINGMNSDNSKKLDAYNDFLRSLAKERNLPLADVNADDKEIEKAKGAKSYLKTDGVHMYIKGDEMMAKSVLGALGLNQAQLNKAHEAWLDMPGTCPVQVKLTLRQFDKMVEKAEADKGQPVFNYINGLFSKMIESESK